MCEASTRKEKIDMKKIIAMIAVLALALSMAGCGKKDTDTTNNETTQTTQETQVDVSENYSEKVDMEKVEGTDATSETEKDEYKGELGNYEITIGDVKVIEYEGDNVAVVSMEYKNKSSQEMPFTGALVATAFQNGNEIPEATVVGVEGVEMLAMVERVAPGDKITLQKAYKLRDNSAMTVEVRPFQSEDGEEVLRKEFNF